MNSNVHCGMTRILASRQSFSSSMAEPMIVLCNAMVGMLLSCCIKSRGPIYLLIIISTALHNWLFSGSLIPKQFG